jgi:pyruvate dehydrogenase E1 component beta subunit
MIPEEDYTIPLGIAEVKKVGKDCTIVAYSSMVLKALKAAEKLSQDGIDAEVIDLRTIKPLDKQTILNSVKKTGRLVIAHEAVQSFGVGSEIAAFVMEEAFDYLDAKILRVGAPDTPVPFSKHMEQAYMPNSENIIEAVKKILK